MASFRYRAVEPDGTLLSGELEGADRGSVAAQLHARGLVPLRVEPLQSGSAGSFLTRDVFVRRGLSRKALADLLQRLAALLSGGISIEDALAIAGGREAAAGTRHIVAELLRRLRGGSQLAEAMEADRKTFPPIVIAIVRAGETSGSLAPTVARLADYLLRAEEIRQSVRSALIYPAILLATAGGSIVIVLTVVLPALQPLLEDRGSALPLPTRLAFAASGVLQNDWWALLGAIGAAILISRRILARPGSQSARDGLLLRVPLVGVAVRKAETARFARTLAALVAGGVALPAAMALALPVLSNRVLAAAVGKVATGLREGGGLAEPLARAGVFPDLAIQLMRIGEATGRLDAMLLQMADIFDTDVRHTMDRALVLLVPTLTIGLGLIVAGIIASVMLALLSVNDLVN